jgi:hypothetical protein
MLTNREKRKMGAAGAVDPTDLPIPDDAAEGAQEPIERTSFSFPTVKRYTSWMQYRTDRADVVQTSRGEKWHRGEVQRVMNKAYADNLVAQGQHAHVPINTPLGQPEEFRPKAKEKPAAPEPPTEPPADNTDGEE